MGDIPGTLRFPARLLYWLYEHELYLRELSKCCRLLSAQLLYVQLQPVLRGAGRAERGPLRLHLELKPLHLKPQAVPVTLGSL